MDETLLDTSLTRHAGCAAAGRRQLREAVEHLVSPKRLDDLLTVTSELINNAYLHGEGDINLLLHRKGDHLRIEVVDQGHGQAVKIREQAAQGTGGWGLRVVEGLAQQWGAYEGTTHVWAELSIEARAAI